ncbi:MAG: Ig-like domain-containing protein, partial [Gallionellaceae bacterium]|nr:Ig-like domain-containing protein [Gallionellaceae bacterium]
GLADSAAVNITVDSVNDPPIANPDPIVINEDVTSTFDPRANDFDVDTPHDQLVITSLNGQAVDPAHPENYVPTDVYDPSGRLAGQVSMTADGQVKFDPAPDYTNDPTNLPVIPYTISDGQGGQASSVITMQVRPLNDSPIAVDDLANIDEDGMPVAGNVLTNDSDVDGDDLDVVGFVAGNADDGDLETPDSDGSIAGTYGTLTWNAETGEYQYTLDNSNKTVQKLGPGQTLTDTFTYEVTDGKGAVDTATLTVTVHGTDDGITITGIGAAGGDLTVHENDLPAGSSPDAGSLSKSGSFSIEALDGIKTVEVGGTTLTAAQLTAASTYPVSIETEHGTLTLTGYSGDDQGGTVSYTYTLKRTVDNDSQQGADDDHYVEQVAVTVTDSDDDAVASSINVDITDDTPSATDHAASGSAQADTNLMFIIDVAPKDDQYQGQLPDGPGMEDTGQFAGNPEWTRLHATVVAMHELIDKYDGQGDVRVYIVVFDSKGERVGGAWMTAAEAHAFADALETYIGSDGHPGGNYDAALAAAMEAYANPGDGKLADAQNVTYFMSDGVARAGDGDTATLTNQYAMATDQYEIHPDYGQSDFGIQPAEQAAWEQFLRDNNIKAYAVGMGGDVQPGELDPIAYDGQSGTDTNAIIVDEHADFQTKLVSGSDFSHHGNLLDGGGYGADGGYVRSISYGGDTFTFDGSQVTRTGNGTTTYAYDAATHQLILTTANQGVLTVDMLSGEYDYVQHGQPGLQDETFTYTLVDSDGDTTAGHTLGFTFAPAGADTPAPADDRVIVAHVVTGVDDPYVNNYLVLRDEWLLWNDSDPQGDPLAIAGVGGVTNHYTEYYTPTVAHDAADNVVNYTWQYDQGFDNHFYYSASDGENDATARVGLEYGDDVVLSTYVFDPEAPYVKTTADDDSTIIIGYDNPDHPGLKNIIHAQGGNDVVVGGAGNDSLFGDAGNDWLVGGAGNDTLYGGTGNDLLEGGSGADTFAWTLADRGNFGAPALDAIRDFNTAEGDRLDLRDLLEGEHGDASDIGNLEEYIDIATDGSGNTVIRISSSGGFDNGNYAAGAEDQRITLSNVDLYSQYGVTAGHESELIAAMMAQKNLLVD